MFRAEAHFLGSNWLQTGRSWPAIKFIVKCSESPSLIPTRLCLASIIHSTIRLLLLQTTMAKSKAAKRKRNAQIDLPQKQAKASSTLTPPPDGTTLEPKHLNTIVSDEELDITVETLTALAQYPNLTKSKACKDLRVAVYDFRQACTTGVNNAGIAGFTAYLLIRTCG